MSTAADWAERYVAHLGFELTPLRGKVPIRKGWNQDKNLLRTVAAARDHFTRNLATTWEPASSQAGFVA